jgi:glycosyltransferase involved in cell wall biosynthesis
MTHIPKLSCYIITKNEERRLHLVLESIKGLADELVIVDSGSTDGTEQIALRYGARFLRHDWESVGHQVKWAEEQCSHRWVLRLDADEVVPPELAEEIMDMRENGVHDAYRLRISDMVMGRARPNPLVKHYKLIRLYDRSAFTMAGTIGHDDVVRIKPDAKTKLLRGFVHHYSFLSVSALVEKYDTEAGRLVERAVILGKNYSPWRMVGTMTLNFFKRFFIHRFFLYGFWGFIYSVNYAFSRFLKFSKFYEAGQRKKYKYPPPNLHSEFKESSECDGQENQQ